MNNCRKGEGRGGMNKVVNSTFNCTAGTCESPGLREKKTSGRMMLLSARELWRKRGNTGRKANKGRTCINPILQYRFMLLCDSFPSTGLAVTRRIVGGDGGFSRK